MFIRRTISFSRALLFCAVAVSSLPAFTEDDGPALSLNDALERVLRDSPRLAAYNSDIRIADARRLQAGLRPNPELGFDIEDIRLGDSPSTNTVARAPDNSVVERSSSEVENGGFGEAEFTLGVSQLIELGGKRARRIAVADQDKQIAMWDYEVARAELILEARRAYLEIAAGQERVRLREDLLGLAQEASNAVGAQVSAGKVTPLLANRAQVETSQARVELASAQRELEAARYRLAALWGAIEPDFARVSGDLYLQPALPSAEDLERRIQASPDLMRWSSELSRREASVDLERALRTPDLTVSLGWRATGLPDSSGSTRDAGGALVSRESTSYDGGLDQSLVLGFSVPLPLFNRNQGGIREAEILADKASFERRDTQLRIASRLTTLHKNIAALQSEVDELEKQILPTADATFKATQQGFEQGKFPYLDVLDTQRTLFEARNQHVDALAELHAAAAEVERFIGEPLSEPQGGVGQKDTHDESR